jgi:segregation and condensation protein A
MLDDKQLINLMIIEPSWEDVIVKIIAEEQMDPWSIEIVRLADTFLDYLSRIEELDLRIPARFILIASILLRMKSDVLSAKKEKILVPESEKPEDETLRILAQLPPLQPPIKRVPLGNVSLQELLSALKKAYEVQERRVERKMRIRRLVEQAVPQTEEDITERINAVLNEIQTALKDIDSIEFSRLVRRWKRDEIVKALIPLLYLAQEGKLSYEQKELFKEILIKKVV